MDLGAAARAWNDDGFVILPAYLPAEVLAPAVGDLGLLFPSADDFHDGVDPGRNARFLGDEFNGIDSFPFGSLALNRVPVCEPLVSLASTLLGTSDIRLYSAEAWAKYEGAADYDQDLHRDYLNHTILVPSRDPAFRQVELFVFLCDVSTELGAPRMVRGRASRTRCRRSPTSSRGTTRATTTRDSSPAGAPTCTPARSRQPGRPAPSSLSSRRQCTAVRRSPDPAAHASRCTSTTDRWLPSGPTATPGPIAATTRTGTSSWSRQVPGSWSSSAFLRRDTRTGPPRP